MSLSSKERERLAEHEATYWWHVAKRKYFRALLDRFPVVLSAKSRVLDIGAAGGKTRELLPSGARFYLVEPELHPAFRSVPELLKIVARGEALPFRPSSFDLVIAADVLEHVKEDERMAREIRRTLAMTGWFLLSVPAYPSLFSANDEALGHYRRYTTAGLRRLLRDSGFVIHFSSALFMSLLPAVILRRILTPAGSPQPISSYIEGPNWFNRCVIRWFDLEAKLISKFRLPLGSSLCVLAKRDFSTVQPTNP
ncbi:MAG TPA: class I SAM-dependent methyltransferase [Bdellovibrionota bacterium]|nr:class I SAM-dependent methyltransferase [Bdellovibrionota bacterium]